MQPLSCIIEGFFRNSGYPNDLRLGPIHTTSYPAEYLTTGLEMALVPGVVIRNQQFGLDRWMFVIEPVS